MRKGTRGITERRLQRLKVKGTQSRVGPLPSPFVVAHFVENRIPHSSFYVSSEVFIEAHARSAVVAANFQRLTNLEVIGQLTLVFVGHSGDHFRLPINFRCA